MQYPQSRYNDTLASGISPTDLLVTASVVAPSRTEGVLTVGRLAVAGGPNVEDMLFTNVAGNAITISIRGLSTTALTPTNVPGNQKTHLLGESIEITTHHNYITDLLRKSEDDTVDGNITFTESVRTPGIKTTGNVQVVTVTNEPVPVNYIDIKASAAGSAVKIDALGSDTDIGIELQGKGAGVVTLPDKSVLKTSAAPTADAQIANKKYVDDQTSAGAVAIVDKTTAMYLETMALGDCVVEEPTNNNQSGTSDAFFGRTTAAQGLYQAMPFRSGTVGGNPFSLQIYMAKVGSPADTFHLEVQTDNAGAPSGTMVTNGTSNTVVGNSLNSSYTLTTIGWGAIPTITPGTLYWIVFKRDGSTSDTDYYKLRYTAGFRGYRAPGVGVKKYIAAWGNNTGADDMFDFDLGTSITGGIVKAIYRSENSGRLYKGMLGVMGETAAIGDTNKKVITRGEITGLAGLVADQNYFLSATTAGALTTVETQIGKVIGVGVTTTKINIIISKIADSILTSISAVGTQVTEQGTYGETITANQLLYKSSSDLKWYKYNSDTILPATELAVALEAGSAGDIKKVLIDGELGGQTFSETVPSFSNAAGASADQQMWYDTNTTLVGHKFTNTGAECLLSSVQFDLKYTGGPQFAALRVYLCLDVYNATSSSLSPAVGYGYYTGAGYYGASGNYIDVATVNITSVTTSYQTFTANFSSIARIPAGASFWIVFGPQVANTVTLSGTNYLSLKSTATGTPSQRCSTTGIWAATGSNRINMTLTCSSIGVINRAVTYSGVSGGFGVKTSSTWQKIIGKVKDSTTLLFTANRKYSSTYFNKNLWSYNGVPIISGYPQPNKNFDGTNFKFTPTEVKIYAAMKSHVSTVIQSGYVNNLSTSTNGMTNCLYVIDLSASTWANWASDAAEPPTQNMAGAFFQMDNGFMFALGYNASYSLYTASFSANGSAFYGEIIS